MAVQDYKINYKSDFVLTINGDAGWAVPFCIKFWTGMPSQAYFVGFDGVKFVNCKVGDTPTQLLVMFDDHHLPIGKLMMQIAYHTTIEEFPGSVFDEVTNARDVIVTIDGTDYQVLLDFTGEDAPELEFNLPAYANEAERIQNELQRQQNEADRIAAELQREQATAAAVQGAENVNAQLNGTTLTVTNRQGVSTSVNTKGEQGAQGPVGPEGPQGEQGPKGEKGDTGATGPQGIQGPAGPQGQTGVSITDFVKTGETETDTLYDIEFSDDTTKPVAIPKGEKGDQGEQGPEGPQGPMGDVAVITPEQQAAFTMYSVPGQNTNGPMTQKAVTDALGNIAASSVSYNNSESGLAAENVQGALDEQAEEITELVEDEKTAGLPELSGTQIRNLYIDHTTGVVKSNTSQRSYKYAVNKGDYIVYNYRCDASNSQRYGFIAGEPAVDVKAYDYGVHLSRTSGVDIMRAPVNGYFLVSNGGSKYPVCNVMSASGKAYKYEELTNIFTHKGYLNSADGTIKNNSAYTYSNKIKVNEGDVVTIIAGGTYNISTLVMYDSNNSIISYYAPPATTVCTTTKVIPSGVAYIRACTRVSELSNSKISVIRKVADELDVVKNDIYGLSINQNDFYYGYFYLNDGSFCPDSQKNARVMSDIFKVKEGEVIEYNLYNTGSTLSICAYDSNLNLVLASSLVGNASSCIGEYVVPNGIAYISGILAPGRNGYIRSVNRGALPRITKLEEEINEIGSANVLVRQYATTTGIYPDQTDGGIVKTHDTQRGRLYEVESGDVIKIVNTGDYGGTRYGFFKSYPNLNSVATNYGVTPAPTFSTTAPFDGFLLICHGANTYPTVTLYKIKTFDAAFADEVNNNYNLEETKENCPFIYGNRLNIGFPYLSTRSNAILSDNVLSVSAGGYAKSSYNIYDDEILMNCTIKPTSDTFNIRFGRYFSSSSGNGTLIGLRKDSNGSYLDIYRNTALTITYELDFVLKNGVEYFVSIKKYTLNSTYLDITINSNNGHYYNVITKDGNAGKLWGIFYIDSISGTFEAKNLNVFSPYRRNQQAAIIGHSFVEGNSIEGLKLDKFAKLLQKTLGIKECGIYGQGGGNMSGSLSVLQRYVGAYYRPKYVLMCVGTNDNSMTLSAWKTWANNVINVCGSIEAIPVFFTMPPDAGAYEGEWNSINEFIRTSGYRYVDMDKCFVDENSMVINEDYLYDRTHPNPQTHHAIYERILQDVPEILGLWID